MWRGHEPSVPLLLVLLAGTEPFNAVKNVTIKDGSPLLWHERPTTKRPAQAVRLP